MATGGISNLARVLDALIGRRADERG